MKANMQRNRSQHDNSQTNLKYEEFWTRSAENRKSNVEGGCKFGRIPHSMQDGLQKPINQFPVSSQEFPAFFLIIKNGPENNKKKNSSTQGNKV